jgi:hypothetical protein
MAKAAQNKELSNGTLPKSPSGVQELDEITTGGVPRGRPGDQKDLAEPVLYVFSLRLLVP